ncbi:MAG: histidinol dehydrogenase [Xanthomonadales bacterium]|nr:histidinol dehydrogenase [Xanthomonadales bacterium]
MSRYGLKTMVWSELDPQQQQVLLARPAMDSGNRKQAVADIIGAVRNGGDASVQELTQRLDGISPQTYSYDAAALAKAWKSISPELAQALQDAAGRIKAFHQADVPTNIEIETAPGLRCSVVYRPLQTVGLYVPGGSAPLVSTVLMLAIPAQIAGCSEIILCSPPNAQGHVPAEILAAASLCGVSQVFCCGGAQAIAAMAYGTRQIPRCHKIFGPGNSWVTEAKQQVSQDPAGAAIDMPAGPSEVLVIADAAALQGNGAELIAWDLLSQAEHGPDSQVLLLTDSRELANAVIEQLDRLAPASPRATILDQSLRSSRIILTADLAVAMQVSERYAPEHLILNTADARERAQQVRQAGSVFIGRWTPESLGDYCSGPNHVLPTYGWARSHSALGVTDFLRRMTLQEASASALQMVGPCAEILAGFEGLDAHRMAVSARLQQITSAQERDV